MIVAGLIFLTLDHLQFWKRIFIFLIKYAR